MEVALDALKNKKVHALYTVVHRIVQLRYLRVLVTGWHAVYLASTSDISPPPPSAHVRITFFEHHFFLPVSVWLGHQHSPSFLRSLSYHASHIGE